MLKNIGSLFITSGHAASASMWNNAPQNATVSGFPAGAGSTEAAGYAIDVFEQARLRAGLFFGQVENRGFAPALIG
jgi:hypothetical protein